MPDKFPEFKQDILGVSQVLSKYYFHSATVEKQSSEISSLSELTNLIAPIYVRQKLWGFLAFHRCPLQSPPFPFPTPQWEDFEIDICQQLGDQIGIAVTQAEFMHQMEQLVIERTEQLQQEIEERLIVEESLRHSQEQLYLIADSLPVLISYIEDISERKEIEQMKDEFISVVSHELRTPLTSIHGSLKLLNAGRFGYLGDKGQQLIGLAEKNTNRLVRLVNDILDLQRLDSGKTTIEKQPCDAADLIAEAVETMQELAREQEISLEFTPTSIPLIANPDGILQTLTNLLSNAIKFSLKCSKVTVRVEERSPPIS